MGTLPFAPTYGSNQNATASTTPASITLNKGDTSVRILNIGAQTLYVRIGKSTNASLTVATTDLPVRSSSEIIIRKANDDDTLYYRSGSSTTDCSFMTGNGGV